MPESTDQKAPRERTIVFANKQVEGEYDEMLKHHGKRLEEIVKDILFYGHKVAGIGRPERLKKNYAGCWSRRINHLNRIIYRIEGDRIIIVESKGHYQEN